MPNAPPSFVASANSVDDDDNDLTDNRAPQTIVHQQVAVQPAPPQVVNVQKIKVRTHVQPVQAIQPVQQTVCITSNTINIQNTRLSLRTK